jgi:hypothetical protein
MRVAKLSLVPVVVSALTLSGCAAPTGYEKAFSATTALSGNSRSFAAPTDDVFRAVKITLLQRGFTIEQADLQSGVIRALRSLEDPKDPKLAYLVTATVDISRSPGGDATMVTASANEQTVLHKDSNKYYHLLGLVPIPTGKDYQTIVRKEGTIGNPQLYKDFFDAVAKNLQNPTAVTHALSETHAPPVPAAHLAAAPGAATHAAASPMAAAAAVAAAEVAAAEGAAAKTLPPTATVAGAADTNPKPSAAAATGSAAADEAAPALQSMTNPFAQPAATDKPQ